MQICCAAYGKGKLVSCYILCQVCCGGLTQVERIINTSSVTAFRGSGSLIDYASTKGAIISFTKSLAKNLMPKGIRVNAVALVPSLLSFFLTQNGSFNMFCLVPARFTHLSSLPRDQLNKWKDLDPALKSVGPASQVRSLQVSYSWRARKPRSTVSPVIR